MLDDIEGYLDKLERGTHSVSIKEDIDQDKNLYKKYKDLPGLAADVARNPGSNLNCWQNLMIRK